MPEKTTAAKPAQLHYGIYACYAFLSIISVCASYSLTGKFLTSIVSIVIGLSVMVIFSKIPYTRLNKSIFASGTLVIAFTLLIITLLFGTGGGGRSLSIGGVQIQTLYIVTILAVFYISTSFAKIARELNDIDKGVKSGQKEQVAKRYIPNMILLGIFIAMIATRNISTAILLTITGLSILFVSTVKIKYIIIFVIMMGLGGSGYILFDSLGSKSDRQAQTEWAQGEKKTRGATGFNRIKFFFTGESDVEGYGRQMVMAKTAISRSLTQPAGPGKGMIKKRMSEGENDFVFAMICEEFTIFAGIFIVILYIILFNISLKIARRISRIIAKKEKKPPYFACYFAVGIGVLIVGQALVHIAVNVGMIPATGQTLPFISRGFTNLLVTSAAVGILINIAKQNNREESEQLEEDEEITSLPKQIQELKKQQIHTLKKWAYVLSFMLPLTYVFFFSDSNFKQHRQLGAEAAKLQEDIDRARQYLSDQYTYEEILKDPQLMEKYTREKLNMKKPNEDLFIIE